MTRPRVLLVAWLAAGTLLAAACGVDVDGPAPPAATTTAPPTTGPAPTPTPPPDQATVPDLRWRSCGDGIECAEVAVPLDHDEPGGPTTTLAVVRIPAREQDERVGALFVNPGGPGGSATSMARALAGALPDDIVDRFDIVGFDPRGVGGPDALACTDGVTEMYNADPTIEDAADERRLLATSRSFIGTCTEDRLDLLAHAGTEDAADDMDLLRRALGDEQISYLGYSYGTAIGQVYADRFPDRVRAMVLDGVVDLAEPGVAGARRQAVGFERALERFSAWCADDGDCPIAPRPIAAIEQVTAAAEREPIAAGGASRRAGPGEVTLAMAQALYSTSGWTDLAEAIARRSLGRRHRPGQAGRLLHRHGRLRRRTSPSTASTRGGPTSTACWPPPSGRTRPRRTSARPSSTTTSAAASGPCRPIPSRRRRPVRTLPPVLVISTVGDPATPYESGVAVADHLATGVLLTYEGDGHTIAFSGSDCIDDAVVRYLVELVPPGDGTRCPA